MRLSRLRLKVVGGAVTRVHQPLPRVGELRLAPLPRLAAAPLLLALLTLRRGALLLAGEHRCLGLVAVDAHLCEA